MTEINFYQIDDVITKALAPLLIKITDEKKKALILCSDAKKFKEIDDSLWSYGKYKFVAHATLADKDVAEFGWKRQSIFLVDKEENVNEADYLVLVAEASEDFISSFARVFYFYEAQDSVAVKKFAKNFKKVNAYKKVDGKWVKDGL